MSEINCCYKCMERTLGCHGTCERYLAARKKLHERYEAQKRERVVNDSYFAYKRRK